MKNNISSELKEHYSKKFAAFGPTAKGVDWGKEEDVNLRFEKMLNVISPDFLSDSNPSILDVGCGYGGLLTYANQLKIQLNYSGIDIVPEMIEFSKMRFPNDKFYCGDILDMELELFDFVVCNGILTQKLSTSIKDMDNFAKLIINKMFSLCNMGIAFNIMTDKVNFMVDNLYYKNPIEMFAYCLSNLSSKVKIDHAYKLYEYTIYVYKD